MRIAELRLVLEHSQWAMQRVLTAAAAVGEDRFVAPGEAGHAPLRATFVHALSAQRYWRRCCERQPPLTVFAEAEFATVAALQAAFEAEWSALSAAVDSWQDADLETPMQWWDPGRRQTFSALPWQLLYHSINHGAQHRSELAETLTVLGQSPGDLDFGSFLLAQGLIHAVQ
jgi:uncharacterized damage-inducible protein DinB